MVSSLTPSSFSLDQVTKTLRAFRTPGDELPDQGDGTTRAKVSDITVTMAMEVLEMTMVMAMIW